MGELADIELGHFYLAQLLREQPDINLKYFERGIRRAQAIESAGWNVCYSILIDDLGDTFSEEQKRVGRQAIGRTVADFGIGNCTIALESEFEETAPVLLETLRNNYVLTVDGASYLTLGSRPFGCSLLTAVWYLSRLGVDGFATSNVRPNRLVNILPIKYLKSEGFTFDLLKISSAARVRKAAERIEYILL